MNTKTNQLYDQVRRMRKGTIAMKHAWIGILLCSLLTGWVTGCGPATQCNPGDTLDCACGNVPGKRTCGADGIYSFCSCTSAETRGGKPLPPKTSGTEPPPVKPDAGNPPPDNAPVQDQATPRPDQPPVVDCPKGSFGWQGQCYTNNNFCRSQTGNPTFPVFTPDDIKGMKQPYTVVFDTTTQKPLFCESREGYYYLRNVGYGICDNDGDGWINIFANQAMTSTDTQIRDNARCNLLQIDAVVYNQDGQKHLEEGKQTSFLQPLKTPVSLVETDKNDGLGNLIDMPVYTQDQKALPTVPGSTCNQDSECQSGNGEVCYKKHCVVGRRFKPAEINTLTKACIAGLDLNDNQLDDANETPDSKPTPSTEFTPLLQLNYFIELHFGYYQASYVDASGNRLRVWVVNERKREGAPPNSPIALSLQCGEQADGFQPDYWRRCGLRDNQQCPDPNNPGSTKPGLSHCWMPLVKRATPSLFKCVVFDSGTNPNTQAGYFHPDSYGYTKNYTRTSCKITGTWSNPDSTSLYRSDVTFDCKKDDGNMKPDPVKRTVSWACLSYKNYAKPADYKGSCIDEQAHQICGPPGGVDATRYLIHEKSSYGLIRARRKCGPRGGLGDCESAEQVCSGGSWTYCGVCDTCPQATAGQKTICPAGVWGRVSPEDPQNPQPTNSCKPIVRPKTEVCDGNDNDCDGLTDENLPVIRYYPDRDGDGFGDASDPGQEYCQQQRPLQPFPWVTNNLDCDDTLKAVNPNGVEQCDGIDNNCDGKVDENQIKWYPDKDGDGFGDQLETQPKYVACQRPDKTICIGPNNCIATTGLANNNRDCCDNSNLAKPGQTGYFADPIPNCGGFDYDCSGKEEPQLPVCQCSRTLEVVVSGISSTFLANGSRRSPVYFGVNKPLGAETTTYSNPVDCQFSGQVSYSSSSVSIRNYERCSGGCNQTTTLPQGALKVDWTNLPKYDSSPPNQLLKPYWIFKKSEHTNACIFMKDGSAVGCGRNKLAYKAPPVAVNSLSTSVNKPSLFTRNTANSGCYCTHNSLQVGVIGSMTTSGSYVFTKEPTTPVNTVPCH
ncbi:MAG: hypothetical protein EP343_21855 [Deltaproteobacteria bacterium]|nr:MAG: hypothetical protein EP343_21855 [Deltaproteobacteria bacterium]